MRERKVFEDPYRHSVYVKGIKMPECCEDCFCSYYTEGICHDYCQAVGYHTEIEYGKHPRPDWCPLVEVRTRKADVDDIADLLAAKDEGRLLVLPCKVGDVVYPAQRDDDGNIERYRVVEVGIDADGPYYVVDDEEQEHIPLNEIGKTVFLTREEAEAALSRRKEQTMRDIVFRGKRIDNGEWIEGNLLINHYDRAGALHDEYRIVDMCFGFDDDDIATYQSGLDDAVDPATIGQFTGLCDKNGTKIFEGDILTDPERPKYTTGAIYYGRENCSCCDGVYGFYSKEGVDLRNAEYLTVIGNIYDNPELIRGKTDG